MLIGRLALKAGGKAVDNPLTWFDELPEGVQQFWKTFYRLEPFGGEWQRHGEMCQLLHLVALRLARGEGETLREQSDFMPADFIKLAFDQAEPVPIAKQCEALAKAHAVNYEG